MVQAHDRAGIQHAQGGLSPSGQQRRLRRHVHPAQEHAVAKAPEPVNGYGDLPEVPSGCQSGEEGWLVGFSVRTPRNVSIPVREVRLPLS